MICPYLTTGHRQEVPIEEKLEIDYATHIEPIFIILRDRLHAVRKE
jgi:hypothetical protein